MPTKAAAQPTGANARGRRAESNISRSSASSRNDEWDSGDGPARKRVPKSASTVTISADKKSSVSALTAGIPTNTEARAARRRQSSIPNGPRPLHNTGKRNVTNPNTSANTNASATTTSTPLQRSDSINNISRFSFASITNAKPQGKDDQDNVTESFLPPVNFDDFHESIISTSPHLSSFPLPGHAIQPSNENAQNLPQTSIPAPVTNTTRKTSGASIIGRTGSLVQRQGNASSSVSRQPSKSEAMPASGSSARGRRQSQFPPSSFGSSNAPVKPRKSIGPGTFVPPEVIENPAPPRRQSVTKKIGQDKKQPTILTIRSASKASEGQQDVTNAEKKAARVKSLQPSPRIAAEALLSPSKTPEHRRSPSTGSGRTPGKSATSRPGSPSTSAKRASMMPHASGLGARTISPTDARRMKRMSMMPPSMPSMPNLNLSPQTPSTPQPEPMPPPPPRTFAQSPAHAPKSATPSSSRTTPDHYRKSYSSGQSLSSSTSYNSMRNSVGPVLPRIPQSASTSRLTTPKPRLESLPFGGLSEEVPPVPAIPKAFESPQSDVEQPFFSARSSNLLTTDAAALDSPAETLSGQSTHTPTDSMNSSRKSSLVPDNEPRPKNTANMGKKNLQPLRLPPLNLLPLSTPTAAKIRSFEDTSYNVPEGTQTPPLRQYHTKTPSTPMTASKASFFKASHDNETAPKSMLRSSSSHFTLRSEALFRAESSSSTNLPYNFDPPNLGNRNISPFVSSSLPKSSGEFPAYMQPKLSGEFTRPFVANKVNGPRAPSMSAKATKEEPVNQNDSQSSFSTSTIRRKLSLNRRRSTSKSQTADKPSNEAIKYDNMPPPKMPASATWSNLAPQSAQQPAKPSYLKSRRKSSAASATLSTGPKETNMSTESFLKVEPRRSTDSSRSFNGHPNRTSSLFLPVQTAPPKPSSLLPRTLDSGLDRDDLVAEEEMKKLASKRKDFEVAARELDALRDRAAPRERISPPQALQAYSLNIFERGEIVDYKDVYFTGTRTARKHVGDLNVSASNFGYDDDRGDYNIVIGDHLAYRYEVVDILGKGSFGQVVRCIDHKTGILVAVKIIRNKKRFHQQALVEVNILQKLREWDPENHHSCVNFDQNFYFRGHLCISTDLLGMNLYEFIKAHDFRGFSLKLIRRFTKQMLGSLLLLQAHKVIHCDLKPENILLVHPIHSEIKVIDFGSSCFENEKVYTYIQSRFYRSPEVILGMSYGMPIDMWSLGCILAELYTGYPIFPGENEQEQLACIMEIFGPPEKHLIEKSTRKKLFFDSMGKPRLTVSSKGRRRRPSSKDLRQVLKCDDEAFLDFISRCLRWDPARRMPPQEAANHEFITGFKPTRTRAVATASPVKRMNSSATSGATRPLPQPPATSFKNGSTIRGVDNTTTSPAKPTTQRRQSTLNTPQTSSMNKRASHAAPLATGSALPRVATGQRSASNKPDLATAAAVTSLKSR